MFRILGHSFRSFSLAILLVWALLLACGLAGRIAAGTWISSLETEFKAASSLMLVGAAWWFVVDSPESFRRVSRLIAIGMTLGCVGDASPLLGSVWPDPQRTLGNMVLFGLGHIAYIRACVLLRRGSDSAVAWYGSLALWLTMGGVLWYFAAYSGPNHAVMRIPALGYTLLLSATAGATMSVALVDRRFLPVVIGAVLFLVSDVLLGVWIFHDWVYRPIDLVWLSYGPGQMLIVFGAAAFVDGRMKSGGRGSC